jgi:hypothetical protein
MTFHDAKGPQNMTIEAFGEDIDPKRNAASEVRSEDVAAYLAQMSDEMGRLARSAGLDLLAYFLDMARLEARARSGRFDVS